MAPSFLSLPAALYFSQGDGNKRQLLLRRSLVLVLLGNRFLLLTLVLLFILWFGLIAILTTAASTTTHGNTSFNDIKARIVPLYMAFGLIQIKHGQS